MGYLKAACTLLMEVQAAFLCFQTALSEERLPENGVSAKLKRSFNEAKTDLCFAFPVAARIHAGFFRRRSISAVCSAVSTSLAALSMMYIIFLCVTVDG
ncbi:MAG: hypothetical protein ACTTIX_09380 [Peptoanaerobacter stomatis]